MWSTLTATAVQYPVGVANAVAQRFTQRRFNVYYVIRLPAGVKSAWRWGLRRDKPHLLHRSVALDLEGLWRCILFAMQMFHQDAHQAGRLLTSACEAFHSAEETLDGQLERDVEQAAAKCWALRDKSVQVCAWRDCFGTSWPRRARGAGPVLPSLFTRS